LAVAALGVGDRFVGGQCGALGPPGFKVFVSHGVTKRRHRGFKKGVEGLEADVAGVL
jgi:hypothetical protein